MFYSKNEITDLTHISQLIGPSNEQYNVSQSFVMEFGVSDEDDKCYPPQALPIGTHKEGEKPQEGFQYLSLVHNEASYIPV